MAGWIKIYRELLDKAIWVLSSPQQKTILITLLLMANHEEKDWEWRGKRFVCKPGQMITSLDKIAKEAGRGVSIKNVRTAIARFEKLGFLANVSAKQNRLITICNWEHYQQVEEQSGKEDGKESGKQTANDWQTTGKRLATNKNVRMEENIIGNKTSLFPTSESNSDPQNQFPKKEVDADKFLHFFNSELNKTNSSIPRVQKMSKRRISMLEARCKEHGKEALAEAVYKASKSDFLNGKNNRRFIAGFDWIFSPNNFIKILEGNYDNKTEISARDESSLGVASEKRTFRDSI